MTDLDADAPSLTLSDNQGLLSFSQRALPVGQVERLEVVLAALRMPAELAATPEGLKNRRGQLRAATIVAEADQIARYLAGCDFHELGLADVRLRLEGLGARLAARARFGERQADLTARVRVSRQGQRKVRLSVSDVRLYGFLPVPATAIAGALTAAINRLPVSAREVRPSWRGQLDLDLLDLALLEVFPGSGWRLPDATATTLETIVVGQGRVTFSWGEAAAAAGAPEAGDEPVDAAEHGDKGGGGTRSARDEAEGLLARGEHAAALARFRDAAASDPDDEATAARILELLTANAATLADADTFARQILATRPQCFPALLAAAVAAAERGDAGEAARRFVALAALAEQHGDAEDADAARAAAARLDVPPEAPRDDATPGTAGRDGQPAGSSETAPTQARDAESLEQMCEALIARGDLEAADNIFEARMAVAPDESAAAAVATERARFRLMGAGGAPAALEILRSIPLPAAPEEGLILRADLGERTDSPDDAVPALNELLSRARAAGDNGAAQELAGRITALLARSEGKLPGGATAEELEEALATNPTDPAVAEELARLYSQIESPAERARALSSLLRRALGLSPESRKKMYMNLGESAEATGDLDSAEQAYWRAVTIEAEPALRANYLVCHARVLLAREEVQTAIVELEEAIARAPDHAGALALLAEVNFRTQDWARARELYTALEAAPNVADVISREQLIFRRATLAEAAGDDEEAEACYREVAILNSRHVEARRALAEIALRRRDLGAAALRLEEVLRLLPLDALEDLLNVRQRLGSIYVQLEDWGSARYYLELVLAQDPARVTALEALVDVYQRHGLHKEAAQACERLARLYFEPSRRAQILYRQGEILRAHVGDQGAASNAFLKASDLDPRFVPTMIRLIEYFWSRGELETLAEVADELRAAGVGPPAPGSDRGAAAAAEHEPELVVRMAVGSAITAGEARPEWQLDGLTWDAALAARTLAQAAAHLYARPPHELDAGLTVLVTWEGDGIGATLTAALKDLVLQDPSQSGPVRALAWVADRREQLALARALYGILVFIDPGDGAADRLIELGYAAPAEAAALRAGGVTDHAEAKGPLRPILLSLASALQGWQTPGEGPVSGESLRPARAAGLRRLGQLLQVPPFTVTVDSASGEPSASAGIALQPLRPTALRVGADAAMLPEREWGFLAAQALDQVRAGTAALSGLAEDAVLELLRGVVAAVNGGEPPAGTTPQAPGKAIADWLTQPDQGAELPTGDERTRLLENIQVALYAALNLEEFLRGCGHTANRIGLLMCASPVDALKALSRSDALVAALAAKGTRTPTQPDTGDADKRRGFLRTSAVRELVRYMVSDDYARALTVAP